MTEYIGVRLTLESLMEKALSYVIGALLCSEGKSSESSESIVPGSTNSLQGKALWFGSRMEWKESFGLTGYSAEPEIWEYGPQKGLYAVWIVALDSGMEQVIAQKDGLKIQLSDIVTLEKFLGMLAEEAADLGISDLIEVPEQDARGIVLPGADMMKLTKVLPTNVSAPFMSSYPLPQMG